MNLEELQVALEAHQYDVTNAPIVYPQPPFGLATVKGLPVTGCFFPPEGHGTLMVVLVGSVFGIPVTSDDAVQVAPDGTISLRCFSVFPDHLFELKPRPTN